MYFSRTTSRYSHRRTPWWKCWSRCPDDLVKSALERLKQAGYMIALDDFTIDDPRATLADLADILKIDMQATTAVDRATLVSRYGPWRCRMLVEKVETREHFTLTKAAGFIYFQGY